MNLAHVLRDEVLDRRFGSVVVDRGRPYAKSGRIRNVVRTHDSDQRFVFSAKALGDLPYDVTLTLTLVDAEIGSLVSRCTCPVGLNCKHGAAVAILARGMGTPPAADHAPNDWMATLNALMTDLEAPPSTDTTTPLALEFSIAEASRVSPEAYVRLRPLRQGRSGKWIRTQADWRNVVGPSADHPADHVAAMRDLWSATRRDFWNHAEYVSWSDIDERLLPLLASAASAGVEFVPGSGLRAVELATDPARVVFDVAEAGAGYRFMVGIEDGDRLWRPPTVMLAGAPAHTAGFLEAGVLRIAALDRPVSPGVRRMLSQPPATVDRAQSAELSAMVAAVERRMPVRTDGRLELVALPPPRMRLRVTWESTSTARLSWSWAYGTREIAFSARPDPLRDLVAERVIRDRIPSELLARVEFRDAEALDLAVRGIAVLTEIEGLEVIETGRPDFRESFEAPEIRFDSVGPDTGMDWLDLDVVIEFEGQRVGLPEVLEALTTEQEFLVLDGGLYVRTDRPELARLREVVRAAADLREAAAGGISVAAHDLGVWAELAALGVVDGQAAEWVAKAVALRDLVDLPTPEQVGLASTLRHYQVDGFRWLAFLHQHGLGGILADDMGLGKTLQVLALITRVVADGVTAPFLVVAPTSVISAWREQVATHAPDLRLSVVAGRADEIDESASLVVTTYTVARLRAEEFQAVTWAGLVLDEAQQVKNHQSKTYAAVRRIPADFRLAVTGTPFENRLIELWALLSLTNPGLYPWPKAFVQQVAKPVAAGDEDALRRFQTRIRPFMLRRTKALVAADLPAKQEQVLSVELNARHRKVYDTHLAKQRQKVLGLVEDFDRNRVAILAALTTLRQLALDPALVDPELEDVGSAKLDLLVEQLTEVAAEGHQALVFSQFTGYLGRVRTRLEAEGLRVAYLDGRTRDRAGAIAEFRSGGAEVFLISLKAGGVGLTLTEASYVYVLDPWWNPAAEAQAVDRAHRLGQTRSVNVYRLVSAGTIEEKVMALKERKAELFAQVLDGDGVLAEAVSAEDVRALFEE